MKFVAAYLLLVALVAALVIHGIAAVQDANSASVQTISTTTPRSVDRRLSNIEEGLYLIEGRLLRSRAVGSELQQRTKGARTP